MNKRTLGKYVYQMRLKNNLSLRDLGEITGLSYSYIHSIEKDKVKPSREVILSLAKGLQGALPDEMLRLGGLLPDQELKEENPLRMNPDVFAARFNKCIEESRWTLDALAVKVNLDPALLRRWQRLHTYRTSREQMPDLIHLYKLANALNVTPDYLAGYTDNPQDYHPSAPRPTNLRHILDKETLVFDHIPLDEQAKEKLTRLIYTVFDEK